MKTEQFRLLSGYDRQLQLHNSPRPLLAGPLFSLLVTSLRKCLIKMSSIIPAPARAVRGRSALPGEPRRITGFLSRRGHGIHHFLLDVVLPAPTGAVKAGSQAAGARARSGRGSSPAIAVRDCGSPRQLAVAGIIRSDVDISLSPASFLCICVSRCYVRVY